MVFQIFVFMQLFNQLNARLIEFGEFNIFAGIFRNWLFIFITLLTFAVQVAMVEVGGQITKCYPLNWNENYIALIIGSGELLWGIGIKFLPLALFQCISLDESPLTGESTLTSMMKKSSVVARPQQIRAAVDENIRERMQQALKTREA
jgi:Ca2+ transporting ATPase